MGKAEQKSSEGASVERVANAAREVQLASQALKEQFDAGTDTASRTLLLAHLTAAIFEL